MIHRSQVASAAIVALVGTLVLTLGAGAQDAPSTIPGGGSPTVVKETASSAAGGIVFFVVVAVIIGGAIILYLRNRPPRSA